MLSCMKQLTLPEFAGTELVPSGPGDFDVDLPARWSSLVGVHGGFMVGLAVRAAEHVVPDRTVRTIATSYRSSVALGAATLTATEVRRGRSTSNVDVVLRQDGRESVVVHVTMLDDPGGTPTVDWGRPAPLHLPPVDECVPIEPPNPVPHFLRADGLLDPSSLPFTDGPDTSVRGYVRPLADERVDAAWLAMICDWFPPPAFVNVMPPAGGISVDMLTHIHRAAPPVGDDGWLAGWFEITSSHGALAAEHGRIVTPDGLAVADSIQTRWTAVRG